MWKWHEGVWGEEVSFSSSIIFGVEGLGFYNCETPQHIVPIIIKEGNWLSQSDGEYHIELLPEGKKLGSLVGQGDDTVIILTRNLQWPVMNTAVGSHTLLIWRLMQFDAKWGYRGWLGYRQQDDDYHFWLWAPANKSEPSYPLWFCRQWQQRSGRLSQWFVVRESPLLTMFAITVVVSVRMSWNLNWTNLSV